MARMAAAQHDTRTAHSSGPSHAHWRWRLSGRTPTFRLSSFPVLQRGSAVHPGADDCPLSDARDLVGGHPPEVSDGPDVVLHLALRAGAADGHVHARLAQGIPQALGGVEG